jgi:hypothetical protein
LKYWLKKVTLENCLKQEDNSKDKREGERERERKIERERGGREIIVLCYCYYHTVMHLFKNDIFKL